MMNSRNTDRLLKRCFHIALTALIGQLVFGCASPGSPDGGPYDEAPPMVIGSAPAYGALNTKNKKIEIYFNEFVRIENASEKVVVSPPQLNLPEITSSGKKIKVQLQDTLKENTTYTIDFSDAIVDNNEGNPLGLYSFVFSTGETADSMEVAGRVLNAENLEPIKGILVGLHSDTTDTVFQTKPLLRVARTNGSGEFAIKGVAPGRYKAFALQDADGTFTFSQKSEMIAFMDKAFETGSYPDVRSDTVWRDSTHIDSIRLVPFTHYTPDNLVLLAFLEDHQERHLLKTDRSSANHIDVFFTAPADERPRLKGLNFDSEDAFAVNYSRGNDTIAYWIKDTTLIHQDTLSVEYIYLETDTAGVLVEKTDTLNFVSKVSNERQQKLAAEALKKWEKDQEKLKKRGMPYLTKMPEPTLEFSMRSSSTVAPDENVQFESKEPLATIDTSRIHLMLRQDSLFVPAEYVIERHPTSLFRATLYAEWRPQQEYQLVLDSAAFTGIYGHASAAQKNTLKVPSLDTYGSLFFNLTGVADTTAIVELLNTGDKPQRRVRSKDGRAEFFFLKPGGYYVRLFIDKNGNGRWDTGDYEKGIQPEDVYYYPEKLVVKALWDLEEEWNINALPRTKQKPMEITKQKPDKAKSIKSRNAERERNKNK